MPIDHFLNRLQTSPETIQFQDTIAIIDAHYDFTAAAFRNGDTHNAVGQNSGSCKLFSFASMHQLTAEQTLACFGDYYRIDVLQHPDATDHQNIRNFIKYGWAGVEFEGQALTLKHIETVS